MDGEECDGEKIVEIALALHSRRCREFLHSLGNNRSGRLRFPGLGCF